MEIKNHRLSGENVSYVAAHSYNKTAEMTPDAIIIHYTAGPSGPATVRQFAAASSTTSAHFVVSEDGSITQMVDLNRKAYHAGTSSYGGRTSYNNFSIGIEISNPGYLQKIDGKYYTWWEAKKEKKTATSVSKVFTGAHRNSVTKMTYWYKYPDVQVAAVRDLCEAICKAYQIKEILGHEEIAVGRKCDPGPAFPLDQMRTELLAKKNQSIGGLFKQALQESQVSNLVIGQVTAKLNFRCDPSTTAALKSSPIPSGTNVYIVGKEGDWYNILHEINGWVDKEFVTLDNTDSEYDGFLEGANAMLYSDQKKTRRLVSSVENQTKINILEEQEHMYRVRAVVNGWSSAKYIKKKA